MFGLRRRDWAKEIRRLPVVPEGTVLYAIGDIHGRLDLLSSLLDAIRKDAAAHAMLRRILVFIGDYVDRGPHSKGVVELVSGGFPSFETVCLKGNHEEVLL
jgi:serine/threonine protein phosphatase 1